MKLRFNYVPLQVCKVLKVFEVHFTLQERILIAHVRQTCSGTVRALPGASYMPVVAFAVSDADISPVAWAGTEVQAGCTQACAVSPSFAVLVFGSVRLTWQVLQVFASSVLSKPLSALPIVLLAPRPRLAF